MSGNGETHMSRRCEAHNRKNFGQFSWQITEIAMKCNLAIISVSLSSIDQQFSVVYNFHEFNDLKITKIYGKFHYATTAAELSRLQQYSSIFTFVEM